LKQRGIFMMATAHPDDENNGLLVSQSRHGLSHALATRRRNGGQNEIGPESSTARRAPHRGARAIIASTAAEPYFTRRVDFGYSFSVMRPSRNGARARSRATSVRLDSHQSALT